MLTSLVTRQINLSYRKGWKPPKQKGTRRLKDPNIHFSKRWGFFDGASQGTPSICGEPNIHFTKLWGFFDGACQGTQVCMVIRPYFFLNSSNYSYLKNKQVKEPTTKLNSLPCGF